MRTKKAVFMSLPNSYTIKPGAIPEYFEAMLNAEAPDRFSYKFLEGIGYSSSNDRLLVGILKELGFLNPDGAPQERYYKFLDRSMSQKILANGIREAYSDLFTVNKSAHELSADEAFNKLRTLYKGEKKDTVIKHISKTFAALCDYADFSTPASSLNNSSAEESTEDEKSKNEKDSAQEHGNYNRGSSPLGMNSLQYHINIVLPDTRDQAVFDAIFKSMRDHLG